MEREKPKNSVEEVTPEQEPKDESQQPAGDPEEDYAGYGSLDELRKATYESRKEGKRLAEVNAQLATYLARVLKGSESEVKAAAEELGELGIPTDTLKRVIREVVHEEMAPSGATQVALNSVRATNPEFAKAEPDFNRWLTANPDVVDAYNKAVAKAPEMAEMMLKGVFAEYKTTRTVSQPTNGEPAKRVPAGAKIPASRSGGSSARKPESGQLSREEMKELVSHARRTGNPVELMKALLGGRPIHRDLPRRESN